MSEVDGEAPPRSGRLGTGLFWAGIGLAPLAALMLLFGGGVLLRFGAVLALGSAVLIGLSITLRPDANAVRADMEQMLLEEIDVLREDVRDDIATGARATHQAFEQRVHALQRTVDSLRAELEAVRAAAPAHPVPPQPAPEARQGHPVTGPPPPGRKAAMASAAAPAPSPPPPNPTPSPAAPPPAASGRAVAGQAAVEPDHYPAAAAGRAHVPAGVLRHTETVHHVTTRSTFVDREDGYQGHHGDHLEGEQGWSVPAPRNQSAPPEDDEESWTDQRLRERYGRRPRPQERPADEAGRGGGRRRRWDDDEDEYDDRSGPDRGRRAARHGEQRDMRGSELHLGERRAAMHSSESGTEMRVEDRWAAVRHGWDERDAPVSWGGWDDRDSSRDSSRYGEPEPVQRDFGPVRREPEPARGDAGRSRRQARALPPAEEVPSWNAWEEPEQRPVGRRRREDEQPGRADRRRLDFELSDERWR